VNIAVAYIDSLKLLNLLGYLKEESYSGYGAFSEDAIGVLDDFVPHDSFEEWKSEPHDYSLDL
jgi:hypothetical protein